MFSYVSPESRIPADHPLRVTREMTNRALARLDGKFRSLYSQTGRSSIPPEQLLRALLLQVLYTVRSERMLMEDLEYALLFRWFVGLEMKEAKLCFMGNVVTENRNGLVVASRTTLATGVAEREASVAMMKRLPRGRRPTLGGDKGYDTAAHVRDLRELGVTPHVAQNETGRRSAIDDRTTTHVGYEISQRRCKAIEQVFGWGKTVGPIRKTKYRGRDRVGWMFTFTQAAYNLVRMRNLLCPT